VEAIASGSSGAASDAMGAHLEHVDDAVVDIVGKNSKTK